MIPAAPTDSRLGSLTLEQYLGLTSGMSARVAGRMLTLAGDLANDSIALHEEAQDPRLAHGALTRLGRAATRVESSLSALLVLAAEHCGAPTLADVPHAIRCHVKTASRHRSEICRLAIAAERRARDDRLAA